MIDFAGEPRIPLRFIQATITHPWPVAAAPDGAVPAGHWDLKVTPNLHQTGYINTLSTGIGSPAPLSEDEGRLSIKHLAKSQSTPRHENAG